MNVRRLHTRSPKISKAQPLKSNNGPDRTQDVGFFFYCSRFRERERERETESDVGQRCGSGAWGWGSGLFRYPVFQANV